MAGNIFSKAISFKYKIFVLILVTTLLVQPAISYAIEAESATIFYNEACHHCAEYIDNELAPILEESGIQVIKKDYINNREFRKELNELNGQLGIPLELQGHFTTFIDNKTILEGHVPEHIIRDILSEESQGKFERIVILQDEMEHAKTYKVWAFKGEIKEYPIDAPIAEYLDWFQENKDSLATPPELLSKPLDFMVLLPMVLATGLLDGINPCAFAVILFLIAFLFTIKKTRASIFKMGVTYISAVYAVYFLIGLGLLQAIHIFGVHHFMAIAGAYLIIALGLINLIGYFFPRFPIKLKTPHASKKTLTAWIHKATIPAALVLGVLVGVCVFPCSGAIYVAIIGLLSVQATYFQALAYLLLYNIMFVLPLIAILLAASNRRVAQKLTAWEQSQAKPMRLLSGIVMLGLGLIILIWFV
ncbi:MAG: cytochrome c biogenesis CcdA family protein [bacterium]